MSERVNNWTAIVAKWNEIDSALNGGDVEATPEMQAAAQQVEQALDAFEASIRQATTA